MIPLNFLIKPASGACNMRCKYCFYENEVVIRKEDHPVFMTLDTAQLLICQAFSCIESEKRGERNTVPISFAFQGGEPTLAGLDESLRPDAIGRSTWDRVTRNLRLLQDKHVETNLLCVVTRQCAKHPEKYYRALKNLGVSFLQFIPCLDPLDVPRGSMPYSLTPKLYGSFLCGLFDEWYWDWKSGHYTSIRLFDDYIHLAMGLPAGTCATSGSCGAYFVVEGDGTLYPCDFYCLNEWKIGKLGEASLAEYAKFEIETHFLEEGTKHPSECSSCRFYPLCFGGCKRDWYQDSNGKNHNYFCSSFSQFFTYAEQRILEIARMERQFNQRDRGSGIFIVPGGSVMK